MKRNTHLSDDWHRSNRDVVIRHTFARNPCILQTSIFSNHESFTMEIQGGKRQATPSHALDMVKAFSQFPEMQTIQHTAYLT